MNCPEQLHPKHHGAHPGLHRVGIRTKSGCSLLIGSPVLKACCTSPNRNLCPLLQTDCKTVIQQSLVSGGECDLMSRRSGSVTRLMMSHGMLSSGFQIRAQRVSIERSRQRSRGWAVLSTATLSFGRTVEAWTDKHRNVTRKLMWKEDG